MTTRITDLNNDDKPREKAIKHGIASLSNTELLAIIIGSGMPGQSVLDLSREMLADAGNKLSLLSCQSIEEMSRKNRGVGPAKAVSVAAAFELGRRCVAEMPQQLPQIRTSADINSYLRANTRLDMIENEEFWAVFLSRSNRVKLARRVSMGGTNSTVVDVKIIMKLAVDSLCEGLILAHNHPSGARRPSVNDIELTRNIKSACEIFGIRLLDHLIITKKEFYSFCDEGTL